MADKPPDYDPPEDAQAEKALRGDEPFIMQADGRAGSSRPAGLVDGPLPTHYEPQESPIDNLLYGQQSNPARRQCDRARQPVPPRPATSASRSSSPPTG